MRFIGVSTIQGGEMCRSHSTKEKKWWGEREMVTPIYIYERIQQRQNIITASPERKEELCRPHQKKVKKEAKMRKMGIRCRNKRRQTPREDV
jgi:hypothetical protein